MADLIQAATGASVQIVSGARGQFEVFVDGRSVARKTAQGFPGEDAIIAAVRRALNA